jgi:hypothetical protein
MAALVCIAAVDARADKRVALSIGNSKYQHVPAIILARDLALAQQDQRLTRRQVCARRLVEQAVELIADTGELQSRQHGVERVGRFFQLSSLPAPSEACSDHSLVFGKRA